MFEKIKEKYRQFSTWQKQPYQVKPLSAKEHVCTTCETHFQGNYCPRCGQSSKLGRYSFKNAFLLFLDVWGLGNRGMFRTLRDLIVRPGYMAYDYLKGMMMAYFPPFKLFFLLIALSLLVESGFNIRRVNRLEESMELYDKMELENNGLENDQQGNEIEKQATAAFLEKAKKANVWINKHLSIVLLIVVLLLCGPLYLFFRHCPNIPDMRFSEFFVSMIYFTDMWYLYSIVASFFCMNYYFESVFPLLTIIPLKQLSGYSYWQTIWRAILALGIFIAVYLGILIAFFLFSFISAAR